MRCDNLVWLVALGSAGVANAEIPHIGLASMRGNAFYVNKGTGCDRVINALNALEGVSTFECYSPQNSVEYFRTSAGVLNSSAGCDANAVALNKLEPYYLTCHDYNGDHTGDLHGDNVGAVALVRYLQGPTCKHGNPIPGPKGGGNCTGSCDNDWKGRNCDVYTGPPPKPPAPNPPKPLPPPGKCGVATGNFIDACYGCEQLGPPDCIFKCLCGPPSAKSGPPSAQVGSTAECYRLTEQNLCKGSKSFDFKCAHDVHNSTALLCTDNTAAPVGAQDCKPGPQPGSKFV